MNISEYYESVPKESKKLLNELREIVKAELTKYEYTEKISYQIPHFVLNSKMVVAVAGFKKHVSLYTVGGRQTEKYAKQLQDYNISKATIQFELDKPLPKSLIKEIIKDRLSELKFL